MNRRTLVIGSQGKNKVRAHVQGQAKEEFLTLLEWFLPQGKVFPKDEFHGNTKWVPEQLASQALIWSWQESKFVTDAFDYAAEVCLGLGWKETAKSYTSLMNALNRYRNLWGPCLRDRYQMLVEKVGGKFFRTNGWVMIAFDGSRTTAPRTVCNKNSLCAPNYGKGKRAKYGKKKSKGMRRKRNKQNPPHPQAPQVWITMLWHMGLRLPWTWRLGPSNSSERDHVKEILAEEEFPENTLFCGDAGFTGYPLWHAILQIGNHFVVRVGGNVSLLSEHADVKELGGGIVLCWPKGKMQSGDPPLRLRLVQVKIGKTKMWLLTSVLDRRQLTRKQLVRVYQMRWGIEVEYRGLKQTLDKHKLRCRNSDRLFVELDWSLRAMAVAELIALREQIAAAEKINSDKDYEPRDRSLANTMRVLRRAMRKLSTYGTNTSSLPDQLSRATVQRYTNHTDKRARYRPPNPDKKPLGEPKIRQLTADEREKLSKHSQSVAA